MLDARQLGLKLIANVTYGYTAASYSGRMPCVEVGKEGRVRGRGGGRKKEFFFSVCLSVCYRLQTALWVKEGRPSREQSDWSTPLLNGGQRLCTVTLTGEICATSL